jgi:hypothetical protein
LLPNRSHALASELRPAASPLSTRPASVMSMGPRTAVQHDVLSASTTRPNSSSLSHKDHVDLTRGVSFHLMPPETEARIQHAVNRVGSSRNVDVVCADSTRTIWTPTASSIALSVGKVPGLHAAKVRPEKHKLPTSSLPMTPTRVLPRLQVPNIAGDFLHSSPLSSPVQTNHHAPDPNAC